jgi:hypothetical protein
LIIPPEAGGASDVVLPKASGVTRQRASCPAAGGVRQSRSGAAEGVSASAVDSAGQALPDVSAAVGSANPSK